MWDRDVVIGVRVMTYADGRSYLQAKLYDWRTQELFTPQQILRSPGIVSDRPVPQGLPIPAFNTREMPPTTQLALRQQIHYLDTGEITTVFHGVPTPTHMLPTTQQPPPPDFTVTKAFDHIRHLEYQLQTERTSMISLALLATTAAQEAKLAVAHNQAVLQAAWHLRTLYIQQQEQNNKWSM